MPKYSNQYSKNGFTLIELLVVIAIIGLLATLSIVAINKSRLMARDSRRKADLKQIMTVLDMYYNDNGKYPPAGVCAYGSNCYVYSTGGINWIPGLSGYVNVVPKDPLNKGGAPWIDGGYTYSYGNVSADGQTFDLTAQLENTSDMDRCEIKKYKFLFNINPWCGSYSKQIYEYSP